VRVSLAGADAKSERGGSGEHAAPPVNFHQVLMHLTAFAERYRHRTGLI